MYFQFLKLEINSDISFKFGIDSESLEVYLVLKIKYLDDVPTSEFRVVYFCIYFPKDFVRLPNILNQTVLCFGSLKCLKNKKSSYAKVLQGCRILRMRFLLLCTVVRGPLYVITVIARWRGSWD